VGANIKACCLFSGSISGFIIRSDLINTFDKIFLLFAIFNFPTMNTSLFEPAPSMRMLIILMLGLLLFSGCQEESPPGWIDEQRLQNRLPTNSMGGLGDISFIKTYHYRTQYNNNIYRQNYLITAAGSHLIHYV